jgi:hypothetical protein
MIIGEHPVGSPPGIGDSYLSQSISYYIDEITTFTGVEPIEGGFRYSLNRLSGIYLLQTIGNNYEAVIAIGKLDVPSLYSMATGILNPIIHYSFDCSIRPSYESTIPSTSVIDALVWSYADMFDAIWRQMETMSNALKLEYALGSDLDDAWGQIFDLPRIVNEDDTSYRDRLKTRTIILNGSGTKLNCEIIINSIIGSESATLTTRYPASVDITFSTEDAIRIAKEKASTLAILLPQMLAHGVSYNLFLPLLDYYTTALMKGTNEIYYDSRFAIGYFDLEFTYGMQNALFYQYEFLYDMKVLSKKAKNKTYRADILSKKQDTTITYLQDLLVKNTEYNPVDLFITMRKNSVLHPFIVDQYVLKYNIEKQYATDSVALKSVPRRYEFSLVLV